MKKFNLLTGFVLLSGVVALFAACGSGSPATADNPVQGTVIKSGQIGNLTVALSNNTGKLKSGDQEIFVAFTDASGKPVDVGAASLNFHMPSMGSMAVMNDGATLVTTKTPGVYKAKVKVSMPGEWQAQIAFEGAAGNGKTTLPVTAF